MHSRAISLASSAVPLRSYSCENARHPTRVGKIYRALLLTNAPRSTRLLFVQAHRLNRRGSGRKKKSHGFHIAAATIRRGIGVVTCQASWKRDHARGAGPTRTSSRAAYTKRAHAQSAQSPVARWQPGTVARPHAPERSGKGPPREGDTSGSDRTAGRRLVRARPPPTSPPDGQRCVTSLG